MNRSGGGSSTPAMFVVALTVVLAGALYLPVAAPTFIWSLVHGEPTVVGWGAAVGGMLRWLSSGADGDPRTLSAFAAYREVMPPPGMWTAINVGLLGMLVVAAHLGEVSLVGAAAGSAPPSRRMAVDGAR